MASNEKDAAIRKRQQIAKTNKIVFIVVAIAAAIVGLAGVLVTFLVQEMSFNAKVIGAQDQSIGTLKTNITNIQELEKKMKDLQTNSALLSSRANSEDNALRVILDALPSSENTAALGASLSSKLLSVPGIKIESITIDPTETGAAVIPDVTPSADGTVKPAEDGVTVSAPTPIDFSFSVSSSDPNNILAVAQNLEKSIRTINITSFKVEQSNDNMILNVTAQAFYLPQAKIELSDKAIRSKEGTAVKTETDKSSASGGTE